LFNGQLPREVEADWDDWSPGYEIGWRAFVKGERIREEGLIEEEGSIGEDRMMEEEGVRINGAGAGHGQQQRDPSQRSN